MNLRNFTLFLILGCLNQYLLFAIPPSVLYVGGIGPKFTTSDTVNVAGTHAIAAIVMAIREINNRSDGIADKILPNTTIKYAFRFPRQNYIEALNAAQDLANTVFNGKGIVGLIGTSSTASTQATAQVFAYTSYNVPQVAYGATASTLGHKDTYPYVLRTCASDAYEGKVLADIVYHYFNWKTVAVFYSGDTYGNDIELEFATQASNLGIAIEAKYSFWSGIKDFSDIISSCIAGGGILKIFVFLMKSADAGRLLEQGYKMGLFKKGTQIIGTEYVLSPSTWAVMSPTTSIPEVMDGVFGVSPVVGNAIRSSPQFLQFVRRWRRQKSTTYTLSSGATYCDHSKDDDGGQYMYMDHADGLPTSPLTCAGVNFQAFATDGSDIEDLALYAYDAAYALLLGLHAHYYANGHQNITGAQLMDELLTNVSFRGLTGDISFNPGGKGSSAYGRGDRESGLYYQILNFDPLSFHSQVDSGSAALRTIGLWSVEDLSLTPCDMDYDGQCSPWKFNTASGAMPVDEAGVVEVQLDTVTKQGLQTAGSLCLITTVFFALVVFFCRDSRIIKLAQPAMLSIVLLGAMLASIRILLASADLTDNICIAGKWLGHLSFVLVFGAMILKTWRVGRVVRSRIGKLKITNKHVQMMMSAGFLFFCIYLAVDTYVGKPHRAFISHFDGHNNIHEIECVNEEPTITVVLFVIEAFMLVAGAKVCWSTKDVPDAVNDSKFVAMSKIRFV